jgi:hypothetical protein
MLHFRENLQYQQHRANEELLLKKRTLLMDEFKAGLWTLEEYRQNVADLSEWPKKLTPIASTGLHHVCYRVTLSQLTGILNKMMGPFLIFLIEFSL